MARTHRLSARVPAELAAAYVLLASDDASYISGAMIPVTGGSPNAVTVLQQVLQHRDERLVGRRHRIVTEPRRAYPDETLAFAR